MTEDEKVENTLIAQAIINDAIKKYYERCKEKVMTPTDAQIEAELTGLPRLKLQFERNHWRITHRVDGKDMPLEQYDLITAALTAAIRARKDEP